MAGKRKDHFIARRDVFLEALEDDARAFACQVKGGGDLIADITENGCRFAGVIDAIF
jgi:hypothetical protein